MLFRKLRMRKYNKTIIEGSNRIISDCDEILDICNEIKSIITNTELLTTNAKLQCEVYELKTMTDEFATSETK